MNIFSRWINVFKKKEDAFDATVFFKFASGDKSFRQQAVDEHYRLLDARNKAYSLSLAYRFMRESTATVKDPGYLSAIRRQFLSEYLSTVKP